MWQVVGQNRAVSLLQISLAKGTLAHAYLFIGPQHVGKMTLALNLAQALNCEAAEPPCSVCSSCQKIASAKHADVQVIGLASADLTEGKPRAEISIDQIREAQHSANLPPFEGKYKIFIIDGAEFLSHEAANCLLKTLEEPPERVVFVLLTTNARLLPATVVSRCQRLDLSLIAASEVETTLNTRWGVAFDKAKLLARLCHGCLGWAIQAALDDSLLQQRAERLEKLLDIMGAGYEERFAYAAKLAEQFSQNRGRVQEVLDLWLDWWRDLMLTKVGCCDMITNADYAATLTDWARSLSLTEIRLFMADIQAVGEQLRQNASPRLALEVLMLNMPKRKEGVLVKHG